MAFFKWFAKIEQARLGDTINPQAPLATFDYQSLRPRGYFRKHTGRIITYVFKTILPVTLRLLQNIHPVIHLRFLNFAIVTRDADVRQILADGEAFGVPYGPEMNQLGNGTTFALGQDGPEHLRLNKIMREVIHPDTDMPMIVAQTRRFCEALFENGGGQLDVITDLITRVATETGSRYFGVAVDDPTAFAQWSLAASCLLFGDPAGDENTRRVALNGGRRLCLAIDKSIRLSRQQGSDRGDSIVDRLVARDDITDAEIRATILGMITGFIPTNTLAAGKMLSELLRRPRIFTQAKKLAISGDRAGVRAIIMEAARLDSALAPGQWRIARSDAVIAPGTSRECRVPKGTVILVSTMTALRDPRRFTSPNRFKADRPAAGDLMFGGGPHACLGQHIATEQLTEIFMVLLSQPELRPAPGRLGKIDYVGAFPVQLDMLYRSSASEQNMLTIVVQALPEVTKALADQQIKALGHPASAAMRQALDATGLVHFSSLATIEADDRLFLVMELSVDGTPETALSEIGLQADSLLRPIFALTGLRMDQDLPAYLLRHIVQLHSRPWGATGLNFNGTGEFSVRQIEKQLHLAALTEAIVQEHLARNAYDGSRAMRMLRHVRGVINQDATLKNQADPKGDHWDKKLLSAMRTSKRRSYDAYILKPSRKSLAIADHQQRRVFGAVRTFMATQEATFLLLPIAGIFGLFLAALSALTPAPSPFVYGCALRLQWPYSQWPWHFDGCSLGGPETALSLLAVAGLILAALLATVLVIAAIAGVILIALRFKEKRDPVDTRPPALGHLQAITRNEDHPGYAQNHIMAVGDLKQGMFRKLTHAFALWGIKMAVMFYFRPGFVINMGTIHYARWFRLPGTDKAVFYSNYNGSWDSYLEDFITRARWGQTAVWSNWQGFPTTRYLINQGAQDGDRFKHWVRGKQQLVPFWYSRFPQLTTDHIRNNALIHHGLSRARGDSEARDWLRCFGSMPRVHNRIESDEVQSLMFTGLGKYQHSTCLVVKLPKDPHQRAIWHRLLMGQKVTIRDADLDQQLSDLRLDGLLLDSVVLDNGAFKSRTFWLNSAFAIGFGDQRPGSAQSDVRNQIAVFLAISAQGLESYAKSTGQIGDIPDSFPSAFRMGMANRSKVLGDFAAAAPGKWRWADTDAAPVTAEAVLLTYAATADGLGLAVNLHRNLLRIFGGDIVDDIPSTQTDKGFGFEHFGFRDGISQPVIRGTSAKTAATPTRDIVEPGEFILGYENGQGFFPPSPLIRAEADRGDDLPMPPLKELSRFPDFGRIDSSAMPRDFGRNGSFLVLRELAQDVAGFEDYLNRTTQQMFLNRLAERDSGAKLTADGFDDIERLIGQRPSIEWVAAKMMGRWRDGRPLVGNMVEVDQPTSPADLSNDFAYGVDDPQGLACPFGAHIRRSNPRDSKQPGDALEQEITNRHRLLRRGRLYARPISDGAKEPEQGILFACLCSDIERQFEFVQQTWVDSPNFHGLSGEPDPIVGARNPKTSFTIPTPAGPVKLKQPTGASVNRFVTVRGGGYFFLPSRSALLYLATTLHQESS